MAKRRRRSVKSWKNKSKKLFRTLKQWGMGGMVLALVVSAYLGLTETEPGRMLADQALHLLGGQGSQGGQDYYDADYTVVDDDNK